MNEDLEKSYEGSFQGNRYWIDVNNQYHRIDGPAIIRQHGFESWHIHGKCHRVDGPAITYSGGTKAWYINNEIHREDGPAIIYTDGRHEWFLNGKQIPNEQVEKWMAQMKIDPDWMEWTDDEKMWFKLRFS